MKEKIFQLLKQEYKSLGLGDEVLQAHAEMLDKMGLVTDDNIETVVASQKDFLESLQRTMTAELPMPRKSSRRHKRLKKMLNARLLKKKLRRKLKKKPRKPLKKPKGNAWRNWQRETKCRII